jgi:hypothetical protein
MPDEDKLTTGTIYIPTSHYPITAGNRGFDDSLVRVIVATSNSAQSNWILVGAAEIVNNI